MSNRKKDREIAQLREVKLFPCRLGNHPRYLSVYVVTRHYDGPEEGSWWYNRWSLHYTTPGRIPGRKLNAKRQKMITTFAHLIEGDIGSVLGGQTIEIVAERTPGQFTTRKPQRYF